MFVIIFILKFEKKFNLINKIHKKTIKNLIL